MKSRFATLALAIALALSSTVAFARSHHHRFYGRGFYWSYNSMNIMSGSGLRRSATRSGGPGGGGGASGGP